MDAVEGPSGKKVLIVDDFVENSRILETFLRAKGYEVSSADCGEKALEQVAVQPPDIILLDLMMPGMDGYEVCQRLKQSPDTRYIPIIIVTGLHEREANIKALEAGADDFIVKPFDALLLDARIRSSLRTKNLQDEIIQYQRQLEAQNEELEVRVHERTAQVLRTQQVAVFSLARLAESRDTETGAHLERMRSYARLIAQELMRQGYCREVLSPDFIEELYHSSPLHDIGKVGIPDSILLKPGQLTQEEFTVMKTHALIGGDTLRAADIEAGRESFLAMGRDIAYYHHERWDGKGYPFGRHSTEIPIEARIVAVSDVYDALSSKRPYKDAFSHEKSKGIIIEGREKAFDPAVVDAFLTCEEEILKIHAKLQDSGVGHIYKTTGTPTAT